MIQRNSDFRSNAPLTYVAMNERRSFLCKRQREAEATEKKIQIRNNPYELEEDAIALGQFFHKYYMINPEVLSCLVQFIVIHHLKLSSSQEIENLKFGDFIHYDDDHGEHFVASKRLEKMYVSRNRSPWIIIEKPAESSCPFPCPVKVLKFYMSKQEPNLITKPNNLAIMALLLQPQKTVSVESAWYTTQYYKPKSLLINVFARAIAAAHGCLYTLRVSVQKY